MAFEQAQYIEDYRKQNIRRIAVNLSRIHDADILEHLEREPNKQGYIKALIRADIDKNKKEIEK